MKTVKKLMRYVSTRRFSLIISFISALVSSLLALYIPILIGKAIDCAVGVGDVDFDSIKTILIKIAASIVIIIITQWLMNVQNNKITLGAAHDLRSDVIRKLNSLPISYIDSHQSGDTVSRVISDVEQISDGLLMGASQFFTGVVTILGTMGFMFYLNYKIALIVICITPLSLFVAQFISKRTYSMFALQSKTRGKQTAFINETVANQKTVKAFSHEARSEEKFHEINERLKTTSLRAVFFSSLVNPSTRFVNNIVYAGVCLFGALAVISGGDELTVGTLISFLSYANQYTKPFNEISGVIAEMQNALACADRVFEILEAESEVPDGAESVDLPDTIGSVTLDNVRFSYDKSKTLIEDLTLEVGKGKHVAIVGPTGSGKTTLINLLMRFYDIDGGKISVDGVDIRDMKRHTLRRSFGMVLQDTWLKAGTVKENIAFGKPDATDEEIIAAAKAAHAHSFIRRLDDGYDTYIGDDGDLLSQGQKQLLCIARVMIALPQMLILDEATSSIDTRTEMLIQKAFDELTEGRTSFIVAHRLSTVKRADVILVMRDGRIVEQGTHYELMSKDSFYKQLYNSQF